MQQMKPDSDKVDAVADAIVNAWGLTPDFRMNTAEVAPLINFTPGSLKTIRNNGGGPESGVMGNQVIYTAQAAALFLARKLFDHLPAKG